MNKYIDKIYEESLKNIKIEANDKQIANFNTKLKRYRFLHFNIATFNIYYIALSIIALSIISYLIVNPIANDNISIANIHVEKTMENIPQIKINKNSEKLIINNDIETTPDIDENNISNTLNEDNTEHTNNTITNSNNKIKNIVYIRDTIIKYEHLTVKDTIKTKIYKEYKENN